MAIEIETKLTVIDGCYEVVENGLRNWSTAGGYSLTYVNDNRYTDIYLDTRRRILFKSGLYLRLRYHSDSFLKQITFRAYNSIGAKLLQLTDFDGELTKESFQFVLDRLGRFVPLQEQSSVDADPAIVLAKNSIETILDLDVQRMTFGLEFEGEMIGTLLLDRVVYHFGEAYVPYEEIEIKVQDVHLAIVDSLIMRLLNEFSGALQVTTLTKIQRAFLNKDVMSN